MTEPDWAAIRESYRAVLRGEGTDPDFARLRRHQSRLKRLLARDDQPPKVSRPADWLSMTLTLHDESDRLASAQPDWKEQFTDIVCDAERNPLPVGTPVNMHGFQRIIVQRQICTMLAGLACENVLKGIITLNNQRPRHTHQLRALFRDAGLVDLPVRALGERRAPEVLERAEQAVIWAARYPATKGGNSSQGGSPADSDDMRKIVRECAGLLAQGIGVSLTESSS